MKVTAATLMAAFASLVAANAAAEAHPEPEAFAEADPEPAFGSWHGNQKLAAPWTKHDPDYDWNKVNWTALYPGKSQLDPHDFTKHLNWTQFNLTFPNYWKSMTDSVSSWASATAHPSKTGAWSAHPTGSWHKPWAHDVEDDDEEDVEAEEEGDLEARNAEAWRYPSKTPFKWSGHPMGSWPRPTGAHKWWARNVEDESEEYDEAELEARDAEADPDAWN
ncbi:hypothetical protein LTS18_004757 [Coniosporium uncinatum]|uniref:Uncharacterized protein n=1 Tax=Coniosporium uncinatum TaxID=93489 RepID=A0ACC3D5B9_9PEZI|nr:hypothetical protein LTS18_004757 [Coniosporium uncinatum]